MSDYDGLHLCEACEDAYTTGRLCRSCNDQYMIDNWEADQGGDYHMNMDAICPDCGAQFDASEPLPLTGEGQVGIEVYQCGNCGHFIYKLTGDIEETEEE